MIKKYEIIYQDKINKINFCRKENNYYNFAVKIPEVECKGEAQWKNYCNWCRCSKNGKALCTKRLCLGNYKIILWKLYYINSKLYYNNILRVYTCMFSCILI